MKIQEVLKRLFPKGTRPRSNGKDFLSAPVWPADLFCAVATLVDMSGCHTFATDLMAKKSEHTKYLKKVRRISTSPQWVPENETVPADLQSDWDAIVLPNARIDAICSDENAVRALLTLLAAADEACEGIGWSMRRRGKQSPLQERLAARMLMNWYVLDPKGEAVPSSLCEVIPADRAVVLPKSMTTATGCTLRSLSHNLALLPATGIVSSEWTIAGDSRERKEGDSLVRLLVVPFPFHIPAKAFKVADAHMRQGLTPPAYFDLDQDWLIDEDGGAISGMTLFEDVIKPLLVSAREEVGGIVHGIVIPEGALSQAVVGELAKCIGEVAYDWGIEFLITGVLEPVNGDKVNTTGLRTARPRNVAMVYHFIEPIPQPGVDQGSAGAGVVRRRHAKHHRWCLDEGQVKRYGLDGLLKAPATSWWENIDVSERRLPFVAFRKDMCLSVLICEDLARSDPALPAIRAVGPNLVVALLMDGPQLLQRWPGRYAMGLAEDPGSSVLTVTCAAMVDRSNILERNPIRSIALWRDGSGHTQEILLPKDSHGVLLSLRATPTEQFTMDHRTDRARASRLELFGTQPLSLPAVPGWL